MTSIAWFTKNYPNKLERASQIFDRKLSVDFDRNDRYLDLWSIAQPSLSSMSDLDSPSPASFDARTPHFFERLSPSDQAGYESLRDRLCSPTCKNRRNKSNKTFQDVIETIRRYVIRGDDQDNDRGLVCGILWLDRGVAINTHQLSLVTNKCKSSINGSFQALGYGTIPSGADVPVEICKVFPFMNKHFALLRQWTIRQRLEEAQGIGYSTPTPDDYVSPAPNGNLLNDVYVSSYLNDECTLSQMVRSVIQSQNRGLPPPPLTALNKNPEPIEEDPFCFFSKDWDLPNGGAFLGFDGV
jgi:hypothetical protein